MSLAEIQVELLRAEYPFLRPDHDPDIERYFELRAAGRPMDALSLYESRLKPRYPDDAFRTSVLRAYRLRDPAYRTLLLRAYEILGANLLERTKRTIKYIALRAGSYDATDAYSTIKAAESILAMLPRERFEAIAVVERLRRYADRIRYCERAMAIAEDLVRAYLNESLDVVEAERTRRKAEHARAAAQRRRALVERDRADLERGIHEATRRMKENERAKASARRRTEGPAPARMSAALDLSRIRFSAADLTRIQIPPTLTKMEDKTLAFCFKYWNLVGDAAFERVLFLYSRKYGSKHYEVFQAIHRGRQAGRRDEEILSAVSAILITGYYYSIRGDVYLQRSWAQLKAKLEKKVEEEVADIQQKPRRRRETERAEPRTKKMATAAEPISVKVSVSAAAHKTPSARTPVEKVKPVKERAETRKKAQEPVKAVPQRPSGPRGSVSDRLRKLSGRSYDVYQDRFLAKARAAIRAILVKKKDGPRGLFATVPEEAEELVFGFLRDHYADPYMNWEGGEQKKRLSELGFELESLDPVIEDCYRRL